MFYYQSAVGLCYFDKWLG